MQLIQQQSQSNPNICQQSVISSIQSVMSEICQDVQYQKLQPSKKDSQEISIITKLTIKQLSEDLKVLWKFTLRKHVVTIRTNLLDEQPMSREIAKLCTNKEQRSKVSLYINHVNNISFGENQGEFYVSTSRIVCQYREENWYGLVRNGVTLRSILMKKLRRMKEMMKRHIYDFLVKFRLVQNVEMKQQEMKKVQQMEPVKLLFEENRKNPHYPSGQYQNIKQWREHKSAIDFTTKKRQFDTRVLQLVSTTEPQVDSFLSHLSTTSYEQLCQTFKSCAAKYNNFSEYNELMPFPLMIPISITQILHQTVLKQKGGFGLIKRGTYSCKYDKTIFSDINNELQFDNYYEKKQFLRYLCKKQSLQKNCPSFENEKLTLINLRNKKSPHIAQYYCNSSKGKPFDDGCIYMDVYADNIEFIPIKLKDKFNIMMQVIKGLTFLNSNGILHRDLKPENVVVDRQMRSKILDLGSCSNVYQREDSFKPYDSTCKLFVYVQVRLTPEYSVKYEDYVKKLSQKTKPMSEREFYEHYFFDIYSFGKIIEHLFNLKDYAFKKEDFLMGQLNYLKRKCCAINPADRLSHEEVLFFIETLMRVERENVV